MTKTDRVSMLCSPESSAVFLDNDVTEFCRVLPTRFKYHNGKGKIILRNIVDKFAGKALSQRPKKGFGFIEGEEGKDIFVHASALEQSGINYLDEGDTITFEIAEESGKTKAINLKKIKT